MNNFLTYLILILTDINECTSGIASCSENGTCVNMPGYYLCLCDAGLQLAPDNRRCLREFSFLEI